MMQQPPAAQVLPSQSEKLPFGGTKPGQFMAQEIPVLYGWGAAPAQRIFKSNEVVGVNYTQDPIARPQPGATAHGINQPGLPG